MERRTRRRPWSLIALVLVVFLVCAQGAVGMILVHHKYSLVTVSKYTYGRSEHYPILISKREVSWTEFRRYLTRMPAVEDTGELMPLYRKYCTAGSTRPATGLPVLWVKTYLELTRCHLPTIDEYTSATGLEGGGSPGTVPFPWGDAAKPVGETPGEKIERAELDKAKPALRAAKERYLGTVHLDTDPAGFHRGLRLFLNAIIAVGLRADEELILRPVDDPVFRFDNSTITDVGVHRLINAGTNCMELLEDEKGEISSVTMYSAVTANSAVPYQVSTRVVPSASTDPNVYASPIGLRVVRARGWAEIARAIVLWELYP